jgi:hypothetical protein
MSAARRCDQACDGRCAASRRRWRAGRASTAWDDDDDGARSPAPLLGECRLIGQLAWCWCIWLPRTSNRARRLRVPDACSRRHGQSLRRKSMLARQQALFRFPAIRRPCAGVSGAAPLVMAAQAARVAGLTRRGGRRSGQGHFSRSHAPPR